VGGLVKGDVLIVPFPFTDQSGTKRRPAVVVAVPSNTTVILAQITSKVVRDAYAVPLTAADFQAGGLRRDSNIRPNVIFTMDTGLILSHAGAVTATKMQEVTDRLIHLLTT
jgi:mRNA interferase MazF